LIQAVKKKNAARSIKRRAKLTAKVVQNFD
jgi:hypothetical protein